MKKPKPNPQPPAPVDPPALPMGRPTDYREEYVQEAQKLCEMGATDVELGDAFGVNVRTINRWKIAHPEFFEAVRKGKEQADARVIDALYHRAMGTEFERAHPFKVKTITYENGKKVKEEEEIKVVMVKEVIPPDTQAMMFWLKNRQGQDWRDVHKHEHGGAGAFDQMDEDQLKEYIDLAEKEYKEISQALLPPPEAKGRKHQTKH